MAATNTYPSDLRELYTDEPLSDTTPVYIYCPMHPDVNRPSMRVYEGGAYCFTCGTYLSREKLLRHISDVDPELITYTKLMKTQNKRLRARPTLRKEEIAVLAKMAHENLTSSQRRFYRSRGLYDATVERYRLGHYGMGYTLPVLTAEDDATVETLRFRRDDEQSFDEHWAPPKYWGVRGSNELMVYPFPIAPTTAPVILTEGEFDALILRQEGFRAFSFTNGAQSWKRIKDWSRLLPTGAPILVQYDNDAPGREAATGLAAALIGQGFTATSSAPQNWKDISELRSQSPEEFFAYLHQLERWIDDASNA
jgi:hypothetical protein